MSKQLLLGYQTQCFHSDFNFFDAVWHDAPLYGFKVVGHYCRIEACFGIFWYYFGDRI